MTRTLSASDPLDYWTWRNPKPSGNNLYSIAAGDGVYVAVGEWGTVLTSPDGLKWEDRSLPWSIPFSKVVFGNGVFVAHAIALPGQPIGDASLYLLTSTDGETWDLAYSRSAASVYGRTEYLYDLVYADGLFVAVGGNDSFVNDEKRQLILASPDGIHWTERVSSPGTSLYAVTFAAGRFVAVGECGLVMTSRDSVAWTLHAPLGCWSLVDVSRFRDRFVALGMIYNNAPSVIYSSPDGEQWQREGEITAYGRMSCLAGYGDSLFTAGEAGKAFTSSNLTEWVPYELPRRSEIFGAKVIGTRTFVLGARGTLLSSENGSPWDVHPDDLGSFLFQAVAFGAGRFVAISSTGVGLYSDDGITWVAAAMPPNRYLNAAVYGAGKFVAVGFGESILISSNGAAWQRVAGSESSVGGALRDITWDGERFVAAGDSGTTFISADGISWRSHPISPTSFFSVTGGGGLLVAGRGHGIQTSLDGVQWVTRTNYSKPEFMMAGVYGLGRFVLVGDGGSAWTSTNGRDWASTTLIPYWTLLDVILAGDRFVAAGIGGLVFSSRDGSTWEQHLVPGPPQIFRLAFGRDTVVAAGAGMLFQSDPLHDSVRTIRNARTLPDGRLRLTLLGRPGTVFDLQTSRDLEHWEQLDLRFAPLGRLTYDVDRPGQALYFKATSAVHPQLGGR